MNTKKRIKTNVKKKQANGTRTQNKIIIYIYIYIYILSDSRVMCQMYSQYGNHPFVFFDARARIWMLAHVSCDMQCCACALRSIYVQLRLLPVWLKR